MAGWQPCQKNPPFSKNWLILVAFLLGLVYVYINPPWQQNDEPGQFEYVWLAAHLDHWPQPGDVNDEMRRAVIESMIANGYFPEGVPVPSYRAHSSQPIYIAVPQIGSPPLYYFLASLPVRLVRGTDIEMQLYMMRLVSLALFVAAVYFAIQTTNLMFGSHLLGWMMIVFIAMLPQLVYRMTAINDDSAAVFSVSFFIWMSVRGIHRGADWKTIIGILVSIGLCALSKSTAWVTMPFAVLALLLSLFKTRQHLVWMGVFALAILAAVLAFEWQLNLPADFYQYRNTPRRAQSQQAVDGSYAFMNTSKYNAFYQVINRDALIEQTKPTDRKVTFGVWAWANQPVVVSPPKLEFPWNDVLHFGKLTLSTQPKFFAATGEIPQKFTKPVLRLVNNNLPAGVELYWDCMILVPGKLDHNSMPDTSENCSEVQWENYAGANLVRNPSGERGWFSLRDSAANLITQTYRIQITDLWALFDPVTSRFYFQAAPNYLFRTFWGRFNWGTLGLVGTKPYRFFAIISVLSFIGNWIALWRYRKNHNWNQFAFLLLFMLAALFLTLTRFIGSWDNPNTLLPQARYFFPAIIAAAFFICLGWYALLELPLKWLRVHDYFIYLFFALFLAYNGWAWYTIWTYWHP